MSGEIQGTVPSPQIPLAKNQKNRGLGVFVLNGIEEFVRILGFAVHWVNQQQNKVGLAKFYPRPLYAHAFHGIGRFANSGGINKAK